MSKANLSRLIGFLVITGWLSTAAHAGWGDWRPWPFNKENTPGQPDRIVALWSDTVMTQAGQRPTRGFGGRLMFYEGKADKPIRVDGTLVVYTFDETNRDANNTRPDRKYVFTPEQVARRYSKSKIGHSYSVWIPWDEVGGLQKEISLVVRFEPKQGAVAIGEQCRQLLPGLLPPKPEVGNPAAQPSGVQTASYETPTAQGNGIDGGLQRRMTTATIAVPPDMASRTALQTPQFNPPPANSRPPAAWQPASANPSQAVPMAQPALLPPTGPGTMNSAPPRVGYPPGRSRALGQPLAPLSRDRGQWQQLPAGPPYALATPPAPALANGAPANPQAALPESR